MSRRLQCLTLRCAAAIETPLSLLGMVHADENAMHCTLAYVPSYQKVKSGKKTQDKQTVKFVGAHFVVVGVVCSVTKLYAYTPAHADSALSVAVVADSSTASGFRGVRLAPWE